MIFFPYDFLMFCFACLVLFIYCGHGKLFIEGSRDLAAYQRHFKSAFVCFFLLPLFFWVLRTRDIAALGFMPKKNLPLPLIIAATLVIVIISYFSSKDKKLKEFYPFSREVLEKDFKTFFRYEFYYFIFFYLGWEFLFRQMMIVSVSHIDPWLGVMIGTVATTLMHIGHPWQETLGALLVGPIFGWIAIETGSFIYPWIFHALTGMSLDYFVYKDYKKLKDK